MFKARIVQLGLLVFGSTLLSAVSCDQPRVVCTTGKGFFAAKYTLIPGQSDCTKLQGELLGMGTFNPPTSDGTSAEWRKPYIAIGSERIDALRMRAERSKLSDTDASHKFYSTGNFVPEEPGADDFCPVPEATVAEQNLPLLPAVADDPSTPEDDSEPEEPPTHITYKWSNVRFYVTAAAIGTQMAAELDYTRDSCTARYSVRAVFPARDCEEQVLKGDDWERTGKPDSRRCNPAAPYEDGIDSGSGISPDFPVVCEDIGDKRFYCLLAKDPPALR